MPLLGLLRTQRFSRLKGFNLIELIIVMFILGVFAAITIANMSGGRNAKMLEAEARALSGVVREAQQYALSGKQLNAAQFPCQYEVKGKTATSYELVMYYHTDSTDCTAAASTSLGTYSIANGISLVNSSFSTIFQVPFGSVSGATGIALQRGSQYSAVCISANGNISDKAGSTCP